MTREEREEAARIIKECKDKGFKHTFYTLNEYHTALDTAIKALEQEPTTKNDLGVDYISRADAIHAVSEALKRTFVEYEDIANIVIGKLPSVTPQEPKVGHWIKIKPYPLQMHDYECSECGHETDDNTENYCSDCGCRMVEPQKSEE